jgi:hypothetical protein
VAAKSNYCQDKLIDFLFRGLPWTPPATWYVALFTATPDAAGGGTEVTGGSYARASLASSTADWAATNAAGSTASPSTGTSGATSNNVAISFPTPTGSWGTVTSWGLFDASTGGNLYYFGNLTSPVTIGPGVTPVEFNDAQLSISES